MSRLHQLQLRLTQDPRFARVLRGSLSGLVGRGLTLLVNVVTLPLTLHYLGKIEYGIWVTISSSVVMLAVLDLGIANTLTTFIAEAFAEDSQELAAQYFATAFWVTCGLILLLAPAVWAAWRYLDWGAVFRETDPVHIAHARDCVGVAALFFFASLPLGLGQRVLSGYQQMHLANYFTMGSSLLSLVAILSTIALHGTVVHLMVAYCSATLAGALAMNIWLGGWNRPYLRPRLQNIRLGVVRSMFGQGSLFFVLQLAGLVVFNSDNLVITHYLGAAAVTPYSTAWKLTQYATALQALLTPTLWPAFTEAYRKGQIDWVSSTYHSIKRKTLAGVGIIALLIGVLGRPLIRLWAGQAAVPGTELLWLMALFAFVMSYTSMQGLLLTATSRLRMEATVAILAAVLNLYLSILLVQRMGGEGVVLASILSFLLVMLLPQEREVRRVLAGVYRRSSGPLRERQSDPRIDTSEASTEALGSSTAQQEFPE